MKFTDDDEETSELGYCYIIASPLCDGVLLGLAACACKEEHEYLHNCNSAHLSGH